jgi:hypothetical protein
MVIASFLKRSAAGTVRDLSRRAGRPVPHPVPAGSAGIASGWLAAGAVRAGRRGGLPAPGSLGSVSPAASWP